MVFHNLIWSITKWHLQFRAFWLKRYGFYFDVSYTYHTVIKHGGKFSYVFHHQIKCQSIQDGPWTDIYNIPETMYPHSNPSSRLRWRRLPNVMVTVRGTKNFVSFELHEHATCYLSNTPCPKNANEYRCDKEFDWFCYQMDACRTNCNGGKLDSSLSMYSLK